MDQYINAPGFPAGGSIRISGTVLKNSAEFQAVLRQSGEQASPAGSSSRRNRPEGAWHGMKGLWE